MDKFYKEICLLETKNISSFDLELNYKCHVLVRKILHFLYKKKESTKEKEKEKETETEIKESIINIMNNNENEIIQIMIIIILIIQKNLKITTILIMKVE